MIKRKNVGILATGSYVPDTVLTNYELENMVDTSNDWIVTRTGIQERRIAANDQASSDLAYEASVQALKKAGIRGADLDMIIVATVTPDTTFPSTANILQYRLGAKKAASFDLAAACSGFLYGITTAAQFLENGRYRYVLVVGVECLSKVVDWSDRNTCILFGDGAGAALLGCVEEGYGFQSFELGSDGSGGHLLSVPAGGSRLPASMETVANKQHYIQMAGSDVFKFAVRVMESSSLTVIEKAGLTKEAIDFLVPHQANIRIIDAAVKRLGISPDKVAVNLNRYGNMSSASIPVALDELVESKRVHAGDYLLFVGFGGGLTWGASILRWNTTEQE
ncbi:ketoacyl-ACP synthase III [Fodinisporobacter ferrooxydans]|uniref:Beta-ketoacyl-[acyl-carrier-protein] synthase III n=1 Tax=Fodinisporobacter ferrooxydans TaxID=2901836 RepID=A0ABY4CFH9_9BACL|nr:ketoacyl-ACP synthase III [Alicyclobacillaceae bacterium MYW30-H2]